ncbi:Thiosulfate/3-mercaptopyruvate sulfurtransferase [Candidatus Magnetaquicoccaceae bacterium FCR-1]|uniref:Thiosulfate/3-mercaptopyruvate sulfurtransferase n=1 Tax=Candidatus Magnetaquiglobus chichijimensis TaxID=3141448 RepID=A0ABQ0CA07_9PROT
MNGLDFRSGFVTTDWLLEHLGRTGLRLVQVGGESHYPRMHLPGAVLVTYPEFTAQRDGLPAMFPEPADLERLFGRLGIGVQTPVVVYDLVGGTDAARFAWTLARAGHAGARAILDGGLPVWYQRQLPLDSAIPRIEAVTFTARPDAACEADREQVLATIASHAEGMLLDSRSRNEYLGLTLRGPRGHLPGAVHLDWIDTLMGRQDPRLQSDEALRALYAAIGIDDPTREVIVYCETAHRAAHTWAVLRHLGWEKVRLYDGSISEWRLYDLPVVAGDTPR